MTMVEKTAEGRRVEVAVDQRNMSKNFLESRTGVLLQATIEGAKRSFKV